MIEQLIAIAMWIEEAQDPNTPPHQRIDMGDMDADELRAAASLTERQADRIEALSAALDAAIHLINIRQNRPWPGQIRDAERAFNAALVPLREVKP